jgi:ABC-2 type transport system ATP-binding protein
MSDSIVEIRNLSKKIGKRKIIDQLSFEVPRGEVFGFLGPNGSGKTTTIRMMVGLMAMTEGDIWINGHSIRSDYAKAISQVGAIVENPEMYKFMSGYDNLLHFSRMHRGISPQRIHEMVDLVGLKDRIHDKVKTYSLGMRQRLGVAQALLHKPQLLILDEPTNGLDPAGIRELRDYLRKLAHHEGITVFVSSHLLSEMELMCDRVAIIQDGKLVDIRQLGEAADNQETQVAIHVSDVERAAEALYAANPDIRCTVIDNQLIVTAQRSDVPTINRTLVRNEIDVFEIRWQQKTLEEQFLEITHAGGGVRA